MAVIPIKTHPQRAEIEIDVVMGVPLKQIAKKYNVAPRSLDRLKKNMPPAQKAATLAQRLKPGADLEQLKIDESNGILKGLADQRVRLLLLQDAAIASGNVSAATNLSHVIHKNYQLIATYLGELVHHTKNTTVTTSIAMTTSPDWTRFRAKLLRILDEFPEVKERVLREFHVAESDAVKTIDVTPNVPALPKPIEEVVP
jgi:hypothetical protein